MKNTLRDPVGFSVTPLVMLALLLILPAKARADLLFVGDDWGTNLYEFDTGAGEFSKTVFCNHIHGVNGLTTDGRGNLYETD